MKIKTVIIRGILSIFLIAFLSGGIMIAIAARHALQIEHMLQDNVLVFNLVTTYVEQNDGAWPRSWDDLKKMKRSNSIWPDNYDQVRKNVIVDFDVEVEELKEIPTDQFRAIRPSRPCGFLDPQIKILQNTICNSLEKRKNELDPETNSNSNATSCVHP